MKQFRWKLDTSSLGTELKVTDAQVFINLLHIASNTAYKDGMGRDFMRRLYNVCNKVENDGVGTIELEDAEFELLKEMFERAKWGSRNMKLVCQVYDAIEGVK